jgi:hypothetical protein
MGDDTSAEGAGVDGGAGGELDIVLDYLKVDVGDGKKVGLAVGIEPMLGEFVPDCAGVVEAEFHGFPSKLAMRSL